MKIFDRDGKLNFIDENNVFVGFDNSQDCCEHFGYVLSREMPNHDQTETTDVIDDLDDYNFDIQFFHNYCDTNGYDEVNSVVFRLINKKTHEQIYLMLFNHHNGYYSHGFEMKIGGTQVRNGNL